VVRRHPFGRIFRIDPKGEWELVVQYDGWPNGLKIHKSGWIFIADYKARPDAARSQVRQIETYLAPRSARGSRPERPAFRRQRRPLLHRPGQSGSPTPAALYRRASNGELQRWSTTRHRPTAITLNTGNTHVYVAITRSQQIWRMPLMAGGTLSKTGVAIQLSGGHAGPDASRPTSRRPGSLPPRVGVWRFDSNALPTHLVHAGQAPCLMTNIAYGGPKRSTLTSRIR